MQCFYGIVDSFQACEGMSNIRLQFHFSPHDSLNKSWHLCSTFPASKSCSLPLASRHQLKGSDQMRNVIRWLSNQWVMINFWNWVCCWSKWYFVSKIALIYCEINCSSDQEKHLRFEAEGWEFAKFLRSLDQFIKTVEGWNNFW